MEVLSPFFFIVFFICSKSFSVFAFCRFSEGVIKYGWNALPVVLLLRFREFYDMRYVKMFTVFMVQLQSILPPDTNIPDAFTNGSGEEQVNALGATNCQSVTSISFTSAEAHIRVLESTAENRAALLMGLEYRIGISYVEDTRGFQGPVARH
ncbi:hypothetical protein Scep_012403 [Stephania cephalantha]|uniref:Uncharacterized protein n=1 Tax=Stephania cephalantha TaxID=152367 RepID=A0AAP0JFX2_9MAGN